MRSIPNAGATQQPAASASDPAPRADPLEQLKLRIGATHFNQRLGMEREKAARVRGRGQPFPRLRKWALIRLLLKYGLGLLRLSGRGRKNARAIRINHNSVPLPQLPAAFEGYRILHLSDTHLDMAADIPAALIKAVRQVDYDLCVFSGDFRARTYGDFDATIDALRLLRPHLKRDAYAVLGNHDSLAMVPAMEALGIRLLLNEQVRLTAGAVGEAIYLAGIDDPHYYRAENFDKTAAGIPPQAVSILLAHSPEVYRQAAFAGFDLMLCGHTHGGQICLPGGWPLLLNVKCAREFCRGNWRFEQLQGYTSVGAGVCVFDVRFNCPPEITVHTLVRGG